MSTEAPKADPSMTTIYDEIREERVRQDRRWGGPDHDDEHGIGNWNYILDKYQRKATEDCDAADWDMSAARHRLLQIAAIAVAAVESIDRKSKPRAA